MQGSLTWSRGNLYSHKNYVKCKKKKEY